jgi:DNA-binding CsgD family transcriptional regulator
LLVLVKVAVERIAANSSRAAIAVLDGDGVIRWTNQVWLRTEPTPPLIAGAPVGSDLIAIARGDDGPLSAAILAGIGVVLAGAANHVELQSEAAAGRPVRIAITPTRGGRGAVIVYAESGARDTVDATAPPAIDATRITEHLTPRELEVLARMTAGLGNQAIAHDLRIGYATVRGHIQSLLAKLGARSRIDAVARAYRSGLVREMDVVLDRTSRNSPGKKAARDVRSLREAEVV